MSEKEKYQRLVTIIKDIVKSRKWYGTGLEVNSAIGYSLRGDDIGGSVVLNSYIRISIIDNKKYNFGVTEEKNIEWMLEVLRNKLQITKQYKHYQDANIVFGSRNDALYNKLKLYKL